MSPILRLPGKEATFHEPRFIAHNATLIGDVVLHLESSVWFNAVLRADDARITVGAYSNIQDGCVLHVDAGVPLTIGEGVTVGHLCTLHGCEIGNGSLIGINSVILNHTRIGAECLVGANTLLTEHSDIPPRSLVLGSPGKVVRTLSDAEVLMMAESAESYMERARYYTRYVKDGERTVMAAENSDASYLKARNKK